MKNESLKKNFVYNVMYQILILIIPLITIPYVSRVLGADGIGEYSFTYSIAYYFMLVAMLGFSNYGNRSIAKVRDNKESLSRTFKEIYSLQFIVCIVVSITYIIYMVLICSNYKTVSYIQFIYILSCFLDINWFFFGIEKFKITVTRNTIIKILSLIMIFVFVKTSDDVWVYTLILSGSTFLSQLLLWPFVRLYTIPQRVKFNEILKHFIPCLKLFLPVIAVAIYKVMDKTMIGIMSNISEVGYYENAERIINVPIAIISALGTVMLPRMTNIFSKGKEEESKKIIEKSMSFIMFISLPMMFGLMAVGQLFSEIFLGNEFVKSGELIIYLAVTIVFLSFGNVIRTQYLIPKEMDKDFIVSAFMGAIVNLIMNLILIPKYASAGACYGTIAAELSVVLYQALKVKKYLPIRKYIKDSLQFLYKAIIMFVIVILVGSINFNISDAYKLIIEIVIGIITYGILNIRYIKKMLTKSKY